MKAGGEAARIDALRPLLAPLALRVTHMGPVGAQLLRAHAIRGHAEHDPATLVEAYRPRH